ncbi:hypothetical protein ES708_15306 [subsurface metagenome]
MTLIFVTCFIYPFFIWAEGTETITSLKQISEIIDSYPNISSFQANRILKEAEKAVQFGISLEDTKEIIQKSLEKKINIYTVIGIFSLLNELAEDGLPTSSIINKAKEGFAKGVSPDKIILSLEEKSENLQFAKYLVEEAISEGANIKDKNEAIEILEEGLTYNIPEDMVTDIFVEALQDEKGIEEAAGATTALSNLLNLEISATSAKVITKDLLKKDYSPRDMMTLVNVIAYAKKNGLPVSEINSEIIHRIREGEDALSIEEGVVDCLEDKEVTAREDEPSSAEVTSEEDAISPTQTTPALPSEEEATIPEEPTSEEEELPSEEEVTTPEESSEEEDSPSEEEATIPEESSEEEVTTPEESSEEEVTTLEEPSEEENLGNKKGIKIK